MDGCAAHDNTPFTALVACWRLILSAGRERKNEVEGKGRPEQPVSIGLNISFLQCKYQLLVNHEYTRQACCGSFLRSSKHDTPRKITHSHLTGTHSVCVMRTKYRKTKHLLCNIYCTGLHYDTLKSVIFLLFVSHRINQFP